MLASVFVELTVDGDEYLFTTASDTVEHGAIPSVDDISVAPAVIDPGRSIGQRESVSVRFADHLHVFDTDDFDAGTFWTKFRARYPSVAGGTLAIYRGEVGDELADMERRLYVVEALQINSRGATITAKDPLTLLLSSAAQAPAISNGELDAAILAADGSATLAPVGIGDLEYPASGKVCIGGSEICSFTRAGDALTLTTRGDNLGGVGEDHDDGSKVQLVLEYVGQTPSAIVEDLLTNYTDIDPAWITVADWTAVDDHVGNLYSAQIPAPESVTKLLDELSEQVGMTMYWDGVTEQLRLVSLAPAGNGYVIDEDNIVADSFEIFEQPDKRISQPWIYYAPRDPVKKLDEVANFRRVVAEVADNQADYAQVAIHKIYSRWIGLTNQSAATRLGEMLIARYKLPPRKFRFTLFRSGDALPRLGGGLVISHRLLVDGDGVPESIAAQIISESGSDDSVTYEAEEMNYDGSAETNKYVVIDSNANDINLRDVFNLGYSSVGASDTVTFTIQTGVTVTSFSFFDYAITVGTWPVGVTLRLIINGAVIAPAYGITTGRAISVENNGYLTGGSVAVNGWAYVTYTGAGVLSGSTI